MNCSGVNVATGQAVSVEFDDVIREVRPVETDETDIWVAPGFVDIQVNGFAGVDFNNPHASLDDICKALEMILSTGVTRCLPTVITGGPDEMVACLANLRRAQLEAPHRKAIAGFHVEGPFIGPEDGPRGAHPHAWVRPPSVSEYQRWQEATDGNIRLVTLSPHWPEATGWISAVVKDGTAVSIGHTGATADEISAAVDAGATLSTHLGNGAHAVMRRHPNYLWDQLAEDRLSASFIVDGIHVGSAFLRSALRAKTVQRTVLVTDASAPAGAAPGRYHLGEMEADYLPDGRVVLAGTDKLAGSGLKMNHGVANMVHLGGITLRDAVQTATVNPARIIQLDGRMHGLQTGERGDVVLFRMNATVEMVAVYLDGERVG
jgi:N-acetylglucosamine-6-phosphate deacetylase